MGLSPTAFALLFLALAPKNLEMLADREGFPAVPPAAHDGEEDVDPVAGLPGVGMPAALPEHRSHGLRLLPGCAVRRSASSLESMLWKELATGEASSLDSPRARC
mmetsp:Transcript_29678/g.91065  ORF Transcript_29678/g.91065 Transcript_29678/m.91065 type:complete len:105 (+) Transcript_29678:541-855(+)